MDILQRALQLFSVGSQRPNALAGKGSQNSIRSISLSKIVLVRILHSIELRSLKNGISQKIDTIMCLWNISHINRNLTSH